MGAEGETSVRRGAVDCGLCLCVCMAMGVVVKGAIGLIERLLEAIRSTWNRNDSYEQSMPWTLGSGREKAEIH